LSPNVLSAEATDERKVKVRVATHSTAKDDLFWMGANKGGGKGDDGFGGQMEKLDGTQGRKWTTDSAQNDFRGRRDERNSVHRVARAWSWRVLLARPIDVHST
jgi:hypothetical protein